ncbi:MAG: DUF4258 domain-containing protein, partial [Planctomycetia bacterium]
GRNDADGDGGRHPLASAKGLLGTVLRETERNARPKPPGGKPKNVYFRTPFAALRMRETMHAFHWTDHAIMEARRRGIAAQDVDVVLGSPGQKLAVRAGREVWHSILADGYLLRVVIDVDQSPARIVTVYRTSKISKYWRVSDESDV